MAATVLKIHPEDNIIVALIDLPAGEVVQCDGESVELQEDIPVKHKFASKNFETGDAIKMYGVLVGKTTGAIKKGGKISATNVIHSSERYEATDTTFDWQSPDIEKFKGRTFNGYHRQDGKVGTRNFWIVFPLVFCENRNIKVIQEAITEKLGYATERDFSVSVDKLIDQVKNGENNEAILNTEIIRTSTDIKRNRLFPNVDGIKFLQHDGGCGGIRQDSEALCRLLAGYIAHPNVAGATILSLGCQHAQFKLLEHALHEIAPNLQKPIHILEQQKSSSEREFISDAVKKSFVGLIEANKAERRPAGLEHLSLGLECGGSDGFSGISANPALGYTSDLLVALGGSAVLSEFPELNGVEQDLIDRCTKPALAEKFMRLMTAYSKTATDVGSGFDMNPSPGNIKDGLITDAMKSAGAARKGGTSPVVGVLDYTEQINEKGLNLLCTPGNDVESTTGLAGSGCNLIVFTTGLGTPTGNPISPTIKMSSNTALALKMSDIIDIDAGTIISGEDTIKTKGEELLEFLIETASGQTTKSENLGQDDFIPWKRGVSL